MAQDFASFILRVVGETAAVAARLQLRMGAAQQVVAAGSQFVTDFYYSVGSPTAVSSFSITWSALNRDTTPSSARPTDVAFSPASPDASYGFANTLKPAQVVGTIPEGTAEGTRFSGTIQLVQPD